MRLDDEKMLGEEKIKAEEEMPWRFINAEQCIYVCVCFFDFIGRFVLGGSIMKGKDIPDLH
jgi:hypothetical protein